MFLLLEAVNRLVNPAPLEAVTAGIGVMAFAVVATLVLLGIQRHVIRMTASTAIKADSLHYATDLATNLTTILALVLASLGWDGADPLFALAIAIYIFYSAFGIGRDAVGLLMDKELPDDVRVRIRELAFSRPEVLGIHDVRTRQAGHQYFVQLHLELDDELPLRRAHAVADAIENAISSAFPGAEFKLQSIHCATDVATTESTTSTTYTDLATPGPTLSNLPNGFYVVMWGAFASGAPTASTYYMGISADGDTPSGQREMFVQSAEGTMSVGRMALVDFSQGSHGHSLQAKYKSCNFGLRWLHALRVVTE